MEELERATYEVAVYEDQIGTLRSLHRDCSVVLDWDAIHNSASPRTPKPTNANEHAAMSRLNGFQPNLLDRLLRRSESRRAALAEETERAKAKDEAVNRSAANDHKKAHGDWEDARAMAARIRDGEEDAIGEVLAGSDALDERRDLIPSVKFSVVSRTVVEAEVRVHGSDIIPKETKTLLKSGKLSEKAAPKGAFYGIWQDYVCGAALRVARETFAHVPVETAVVHVLIEMLDPKTGHLAEQPVLSVAMPRQTVDRLNIDLVSPSDSMSNFVHQMDFKKTQGFRAVEKMDSGNLLS